MESPHDNPHCFPWSTKKNITGPSVVSPDSGTLTYAVESGLPNAVRIVGNIVAIIGLCAGALVALALLAFVVTTRGDDIFPSRAASLLMLAALLAAFIFWIAYIAWLVVALKTARSLSPKIGPTLPIVMMHFLPILNIVAPLAAIFDLFAAVHDLVPPDQLQRNVTRIRRIYWAWTTCWLGFWLMPVAIAFVQEFNIPGMLTKLAFLLITATLPFFTAYIIWDVSQRLAVPSNLPAPNVNIESEPASPLS